MSEYLPAPVGEQFPLLERDSSWVRVLPSESHIARIFRAGGPHPTQWFDFREYGPLDGRFDPHPLPTGESPGIGVMYGVLASEVAPEVAAPPILANSPFTAAILEVFQAQRIIRLNAGMPTFAGFATTRPLHLLDLADSDWVTAAGGNAAISSGERASSRAWARAIVERYPEIDGVISPSSLLPRARIVTLWSRAASALPVHPDALIRLDRAELSGVIDAIAERYRYTLVSTLL